MPVPSEPERYTIDEMMERLKQRSTEDPATQGELVTRADGTQAIRVRKRKRRSHQPHKEEERKARRARMIQVSGALILLLIGLFAAGVAIAYANSAPFRNQLVAKIQNASGARAELQQFRMNPTSANANLLALTWPAGNALESLNLRGIRAEIHPTSFLGQTFSGEEIRASEGTLQLRIPNPSEPFREDTTASKPGQIRFIRYAIPRLNVAINAGTTPVLHLQQSDASFQTTTPSGRPQLLLSRGDLSIPGWQKLRMDRSHIEFRGKDVDIIGLRLLPAADNRGTFELSGSLQPYLTDRPSSLAVHLDSFPFSGLVGNDLGLILNGRIDSIPSQDSNTLTFALDPEPQPDLSIRFRSSLGSPFEISGFPFLNVIARLLDDNWFVRPAFDSDVTGSLRRSKGRITLDHLNLENKGRMAIRGSIFQTADRQLSGNLEIGIAKAMLTSSRNARLDRLFGPSDEHFRWLSIKISGTGQTPADNFLQLYDATAGSSPSAPKNPAPDTAPSFEELTQPD